MKRSVPAAVIFTALAAVPAPAWAKSSTSPCRAPEPVLFTCDVGTETVSICGQEQGGAAYRFGRASRIELEATDLHRAHEGWWGGGETQVYADTPTHRYIVYDQMVRTAFGHDGLHDAKITTGLLVQRGGRTVSNRECALPKTYDPSTAVFDQQSIQKLIPEGAYVPH